MRSWSLVTVILLSLTEALHSFNLTAPPLLTSEASILTNKKQTLTCPLLNTATTTTPATNQKLMQHLLQCYSLTCLTSATTNTTTMYSYSLTRLTRLPRRRLPLIVLFPDATPLLLILPDGYYVLRAPTPRDKSPLDKVHPYSSSQLLHRC